MTLRRPPMSPPTYSGVRSSRSAWRLREPRARLGRRLRPNEPQYSEGVYRLLNGPCLGAHPPFAFGVEYHAQVAELGSLPGLTASLVQPRWVLKTQPVGMKGSPKIGDLKNQRLEHSLTCLCLSALFCCWGRGEGGPHCRESKQPLPATPSAAGSGCYPWTRPGRWRSRR